MSELVTISAGESSSEVERISCFLSAVMGFSAIVFVAKNAGIKEFFDACKPVWENITQDEDLLKKWVCKCDTINVVVRLMMSEVNNFILLLLFLQEHINNHPEWLGSVKELFGSVEKSSMFKVKQINKSGEFIIGKETIDDPTTESCLRLQITSSDKWEQGA